jgi:hypothetical protein
MAERGAQIDIAMFATASESPLPASAHQYEVTDHKPLPKEPPHLRMALCEVTAGQPLTDGAWRFQAISDQIEKPGGAEATGILLVNFLNVEPGAEDAVNKWFIEEHLPDLLALDGYINGQRFAAIDGQDLPYLFLNLWEVDPDRAMKSLAAQRSERDEALREGRQPKVRVHRSLLADQRMGGIYRPSTRSPS